MSMMVRVYDTDTVQEIAKKIYEQFDIMSSCSIFGFVMNERTCQLVPKGEMVLSELKLLDELENCRYVGNKKIRNFTYRKNSVGGPIAHKMFTWEKRIVDGEPRYTIWRYQ